MRSFFYLEEWNISLVFDISLVMILFYWYFFFSLHTCTQNKYTIKHHYIGSCLVQGNSGIYSHARKNEPFLSALFKWFLCKFCLIKKARSVICNLNKSECVTQKLIAVLIIIERWMRMDILSSKPYLSVIPRYVAYLIQDESLYKLCVKTLSIHLFFSNENIISMGKYVC